MTNFSKTEIVTIPVIHIIHLTFLFAIFSNTSFAALIPAITSKFRAVQPVILKP